MLFRRFWAIRAILIDFHSLNFAGDRLSFALMRPRKSQRSAPLARGGPTDSRNLRIVVCKSAVMLDRSITISIKFLLICQLICSITLKSSIYGVNTIEVRLILQLQLLFGRFATSSNYRIHSASVEANSETRT